MYRIRLIQILEKRAFLQINCNCEDNEGKVKKKTYSIYETKTDKRLSSMKYYKILIINKSLI